MVGRLIGAGLALALLLSYCVARSMERSGPIDSFFAFRQGPASMIPDVFAVGVDRKTINESLRASGYLPLHSVDTPTTFCDLDLLAPCSEADRGTFTDVTSKETGFCGPVLQIWLGFEDGRLVRAAGKQWHGACAL